MELVYSKSKINFKYKCDNCGTRFNWNEKSVRYGTIEGDKTDPTFCNYYCYNQWRNDNLI